MGEGRVKRKVGTCANCGTRHTNAAEGCVCYLCGGLLRAEGDVLVPALVPAFEPAPVCSRALINELYARRESD